MNDSNARAIIVSFRLTPAEAAHLDAAGAALSDPRSRADFARAAALATAHAHVPDPPKAIRRPGRRKPTYDVELLSKILGQLGKIGSNLNQIAKTANSGGGGPSPRMLTDISMDMIEVRNAVRAALDGGRHDDDVGAAA